MASPDAEADPFNLDALRLDMSNFQANPGQRRRVTPYDLELLSRRVEHLSRRVASLEKAAQGLLAVADTPMPWSSNAPAGWCDAMICAREALRLTLGS
jgi:hypothetical protein